MISKFSRMSILCCNDVSLSDVRISDRLDEIDKWRKTLEYTIQDIDREIQAIQTSKEQCERYFESMRRPLGLCTVSAFKKGISLSLVLDVALENHVTRDGRKAIDNVDDEPERELKKVVEYFPMNFTDWKIFLGSLCY